jgi:hypothetical protein
MYYKKNTIEQITTWSGVYRLELNRQVKILLQPSFAAFHTSNRGWIFMRNYFRF